MNETTEYKDRRHGMVRHICVVVSLVMLGLISGVGLSRASADQPFEVDPYTTVLVHMDEGSGNYAYDATGNYRAALKTTWTTGGKFGNGLNFDGSTNRASIGSSPTVGYQGLLVMPITIDLWIKTPGNAANPQNLIRQETAYNLFITADGKIAFDLCIGGYTWVGALVGTTVVTDDSWHLVSVSYDRYERKIYVDGILDATDAVRGYTWFATPFVVVVGAYPSGYVYQYYFKGVMDELRISDIDRFADPIEVPVSAYGWNFFGIPSQRPVQWSSCYVTDGVATKTIASAETAGWLDADIYWWGWDAENLQFKFYSTPTDDAYLQWNRGYWLSTNVSGLTLLIPRLESP
jgi:hypothetical protein